MPVETTVVVDLNLTEAAALQLRLMGKGLKGRMLEGAHRETGALVTDANQRRALGGRDPRGRFQSPGLKPTTKLDRTALGFPAGAPILVRTGGMVRSVNFTVRHDVGQGMTTSIAPRGKKNVAKGTILHFGGRSGKGGQTDTPGREWLGLAQVDINRTEKVFRRTISELLQQVAIR